MEYKVVRHSESNDDYIEHAIFGLGSKKGGMQKGGQKENHLYLARQWIKNKWRYAYTQAQLKAMQNWGRGRGTTAYNAQMAKLRTQSMTAQRQANIAADKLQRSTKKTINKAQSSVSNAVNSAREYASDKANKARNVAEKALSDAGDTARDVRSRASNAANSAREYASDKANKARNVAEKALSDAGDTARDVRSRASNAVNSAREYASDKANKARNVAEKALSDAGDLPDKGKKKVDHMADVLSGNYAKKLDENTRRYNEYQSRSKKTYQVSSSTKEDEAKRALEAYLARMDNNDKHAESNRNNEKAKQSADYKVSKAISDAKRSASDKVNKARNVAEKALSDAGDTINKGRSTVDDLLGKARSSASNAASTTLKAASDLADKGKKKVDHMTDVLSGNYAKEINRNIDRIKEEINKEHGKATQARDTIDDLRESAKKDVGTLYSNSERLHNARQAEKRAYVNSEEKVGKFIDETSKKQDLDYKISQGVNDAKRVVSDAASKLKGSASSAVSSAQSKANAALKDAQSLAADVRDLAAENIRYYTNKDYRNLSNAADSLGRQLDTLDDAIAEASRYPDAANAVRGLQQQRWMIAQQLNQAEQQLDNIKNKK